MRKIHQDYLTDVSGNKKAVVIPFVEWQQIIEELEELDDIRAYDKVRIPVQTCQGFLSKPATHS